jgi:hypothetical protein
MSPCGDLEGLFQEVSEEYLKEHDCFSTRGELGVFSHASVVWLGIQQRLTGNTLQTSLSTLIERIKEDTSPLNLILNPGKKIRNGKVSLNTGGVSRARSRLPEQVVAELFAAATENIETKLTSKENIYLMDGQVLTIARTDSNLKDFGSTGNGEGELHFPRMRVVSAHSLETGVAKQLAIGTWHDSEVKLAADVITALPKESILVMDRFFDKPTFLAKAQERDIQVVLRVRDMVARRLFGTIPKEAIAEKEVVWIPVDKKLSAIQIKGRIIKFTVAQSGFRTSEFYFFTTASQLSLDEVAALYRQRVKVEVFIRQLKQTLKLFFVRARKAENVRKEIYIAYLTFNLMRAVMQLAAIKGGVDPARMSFTATVTLCQTYAGLFLKARSSAERDKLYDDFVEHLLQAKLPNRKKERSYPRVVKLPRNKYPARAIVKDYFKKEGK